MKEHTPTMNQEEIQIYARVGELIAKKFEHKLHEETIIEDIMGALHQFERTPEAESVVKHIVFNRQLMAERFL